MDIRKILDIPFLYDLYHDIIGHEKRTFAEEYMGDLKGKTILDIGCGTAQILSRIRDYDLYMGIDMSQRYIDYAYKKYGAGPNVEFRCLNLNDLAEDCEYRFDMVLMMGIMMNLNDDEINHIMKVIRGIMSDDGMFLSYDSVYLEKNNPIAKFLLDFDRGFHLRDTKGYVDLMEANWGNVDYDIRLDMMRVPYNEILFKCRNN